MSGVGIQSGHSDMRPTVATPDQASDGDGERERERGEFDPLFFLAGEKVGRGLYQVDDDYFVDRVVREIPSTVQFDWHGRGYEADLPEGLELPALLEVTGLDEPPVGSLLLSLRHRPSILNLFRPPIVHQGMVKVRPIRVS